MSRTLTSEQLLRHFIGFNPSANNGSAFPPHNIEKLSETHYLLTLAVAGFSREEIEATVFKGTLTIKGKKNRNPPGFRPDLPYLTRTDGKVFQVLNHDKTGIDDEATAKQAAAEVLYQGITFRDWERNFHLGEHIQVTNAQSEDGLLHIHLEERIPEEAKPKRIGIW